ncbi:WXG100 family type VII secretion target [Streptosporangium saharense]|uniref:WXG100 family type VII secretion target n=1 Tax=Streptosporangium saharense TaxID=1706840 RepID=UPI0036B8D182
MAQTGSNRLKYGIEPQETSLSITLFDSVMDQVRDWVDDTHPAAVKRAGDYYVAAHDLLQDAAVTLKQRATDLAGKYNGTESVEAQKELQRLHASIRELAGKMRQVGTTLRGYSETLSWAQRNIVTKRGQDSRSDHDTDWADNIPFYGMYRVEDRARDRFNEINQKIIQHYKELPDEVQYALPTPVQLPMPKYDDVTLPGGPKGTVTGPGSGGYDGTSTRLSVNDPTNGLGLNGSDLGGLDGLDGAGGPGDLGGPGQDGTDPSGRGPGSIDGFPPGPGTDGSGSGPGSGVGGLDPNVINPGSPNGSLPGVGANGTGTGTTTLAGLGDPANLGLTNGTIGQPNGQGAYPFSNGLNGNGTGTGPGIGSPNGVGGFGGVGGVGGAGGVGAAGAGGLRAAGASGMPMVPFGAGGAGAQENQEQESTTWLLEDDEVWGSGGDTIPPVIT